MKAFKTNLPFNILILALLLFCYINTVIMQGLTFDGAIYASIAMNMAHGIGSLWAPVFSKTFFSSFHEHPSLGFYLQSFFFRLFGDGFYVEKLYDAFAAAINIFFMFKIWQLVNPKVKLTWLIWLPVLLWFLVPGNLNTYKNNYLEVTLTCFTNAAVYYLLKSRFKAVKFTWFYLPLSAALIVAAFFTNGLQAFFPLVTLILYALFFRENTFKSVLVQTLILLLLAGLFMCFIFIVSPAAWHNIKLYFIDQIYATLTEHHGGSYVGMKRLLIFPLILNNLLPLVAMALILIGLKVKKWKLTFKQPFFHLFKDKWIYYFFLLGLSASVPVLLSTKQDPHYIAQSFPFFVLAFLQLLSPLFTVSPSRSRFAIHRYFAILIFSLILLFVSIFHLFSVAGNLRDPDRSLGDTLILGNTIPRGAIISLGPQLLGNGQIPANFYRYWQISLIPFNKAQECYLLWAITNTDKNISGYKILPIVGLQHFVLYKKLNC